MRAASMTVVLLGTLATAAAAQGLRLNPYAGWYHFDESSFESGFDTSEADSDPVYGLRLGIGLIGGWSVDLAYGRTTIEAEGFRGDVQLSSDATIQLFYGALNWDLPLTGPLDLFLSGGVGGIDTDFDEAGGGTNMLVNYGVGIAIPVGSLRLRGDLKDQVDLCDAPDEFDFDGFEACFEDEALHNIELTAGIEIPL